MKINYMCFEGSEEDLCDYKVTVTYICSTYTNYICMDIYIKFLHFFFRTVY